MKKLKIVTGAETEILRTVCEPVKHFDSELRSFVEAMKKAMIKASGLGIAAPQVGENRRVFITTLDYKKKTQMMIAMVNPEITWRSAEMEIDEEGCLSLPGVYGKVARPKAVKVEFFNLDGGRQVMELEGLNARVVQHELDHLNGVLFIDKLAA